MMACWSPVGTCHIMQGPHLGKKVSPVFRAVMVVVPGVILT